MNNLISICCPSRGRPELAEKFCQSINKTSTNVEVLFHVDLDDKFLNSYLQLENSKVRIITGVRNTLGTLYNRLWREAKGDIFLIIGDDQYFLTSDWDEIVLKNSNLVSEGIFYFYGYDPSYVFVSKKICDVLGYLAPAMLNRYIDSWHFEIGRMIKKLYSLPLVIDHVHPYNNRRPKDSTYLDLTNIWKKDSIIFENTLNIRRMDAESLKYLLNKENKILLL